MIKFLTRYNFHFLLLPVFFVWHVCNEYFGLVTWPYILEYTGYYLVLSLLVFAIGRLLLKSNPKAAIWASVLLTIFFFFGAFHDFVKTSTLFSIISSYSILLPLIFVIVVVSVIVLKRTQKKHVRLTAYLNAVILFLTLLELQVTIYQLITKESKKNNLSYNSVLPKIDITNLPDSLKPDIFFIIFDEFASTRSLEKYLGFDNSRLDSLLTKKGFHLATNSNSNYNSTPHSIASTLSLQYLEADLEKKLYTPATALKAQETVRLSYFPNMLIANGYKFLNYSIFDIAGVKSPNQAHFNIHMPKLLSLETLWGRIKRDIWWNIVLFVNSETDMDQIINKSESPNPQIFLNKVNNTLTALKSTFDKPVFLYTHILLPHASFHFTSNGAIRKLMFIDDQYPRRDSLYLDQLQFCNTLIDSLASASNFTKTNRPRVIVIASDHGYRSRVIPENLRDKEFMNLNAIYFSDKNYSNLSDSISSVNIFRHIANKYFQTHLPLLKDSTIMLY